MTDKKNSGMSDFSFPCGDPKEIFELMKKWFGNEQDSFDCCSMMGDLMNEKNSGRSGCCSSMESVVKEKSRKSDKEANKV